MIVQSDERLLRAIVALKTRPEGLAFFEWLAQSQRQTSDALIELRDEIDVRREQGSADTLRIINTIVERADTLLQAQQRRK